MAENLVLLHGFAGTRDTWDAVVALLDRERYTPLALDLPGHGEHAREEASPNEALAGEASPGELIGGEASPGELIGGEASPGELIGGEASPGEFAAVRRAITFPACVQHVLARSPQRFTLCGYSLGGRVALHVALAAPERVGRLVLVSSTAGIADPRERAARRVADGALADALEHESFMSFMDHWQAQPVFAADPPEVHARMRAEQQRNDPLALAAVLRGIGTGEMEPLWDRLSELTMPVAVLAGARDVKFHAPGRRFVELLPNAAFWVVGGGHRLPVENPQSVADALDWDW